jgi:hypothetical protein
VNAIYRLLADVMLKIVHLEEVGLHLCNVDDETTLAASAAGQEMTSRFSS